MQLQGHTLPRLSELKLEWNTVASTKHYWDMCIATCRSLIVLDGKAVSHYFNSSVSCRKKMLTVESIISSVQSGSKVGEDPSSYPDRHVAYLFSEFRDCYASLKWMALFWSDLFPR